MIKISANKSTKEDRKIVKVDSTTIATVAKIQYPDKQSNTPVLPEEVVKKLPALILALNHVARNERVRDILYLGMLCMLSSLFPSVLTYHGMKEVASNFYLVISANAAGGKGLVNLILELAELVDAQLKHEFQQSEQDGEDVPVPNSGGLFISANSSQAALMRRLGASMHNFLFDSEADLLTHTRKHEWSQLDPDLRKAFHHERISVARKKEEFEISHPKLSMLLTGTPSQCKMLGESIENGLVSRLCVYLYKAPREWINQFEIPADEGIAWKTNLQQTVLDLFNYIRTNPFRFEFTQRQQSLHTEYFESEILKVEDDSPFNAALKRQGLLATRISMILTCIRRFEEQKTGPIEYCHDQDFECAMGITEVTIEHLKIFYELLSGTKPGWVIELLEILNDEFTTEEFMCAYKAKFRLQPRMAYYDIRFLIESGWIIKVGQALFKKVL